MEQEELKTQITEHVQEKVAVMEEKAKTTTVWYKKIGYYVAAAAGAVVIQLVNLYGNEVIQAIQSAFTGLF